MLMVQFIWKKSCDTCRRYKKQLDIWGVEYISREINSEPLTRHEILEMIGDHPVKPFLNTRNAKYRELKLSKNVPDREEAAVLIAETNNLLKRPILVVDDEIIIGNDIAGARVALGLD